MRARFVLALAFTALSAGASQAGFFDGFNYPNGGLVANSGGVWQVWEGFGNDDGVIGGAVDFTGFASLAPDVEAQFTNILAGTTKAVFSYDFFISGSGDNTPQINLGPDNWGPGYNYDGVLITFFNLGGPGTLNVATNQGGNLPLGTVSLNQWHRMEVDIVQAAGNAYYSFWIDGVPNPVTNWSVLDPIRGLNAVELGAIGTDGNPATFILVDNVCAGLPEPTTLSLLALGGLGLLRRARARRAR